MPLDKPELEFSYEEQKALITPSVLGKIRKEAKKQRLKREAKEKQKIIEIQSKIVDPNLSPEEDEEMLTIMEGFEIEED